TVFDDLMGFRSILPFDTLAQAALNRSTALQQLGRLEESIKQLDEVSVLARDSKLSPTLVTQITQKSLEVRLQQRSWELETTQQQLQKRCQELSSAQEKVRENQLKVAEVTSSLRHEEALRMELEAQLQS